MGTNNCSPPRAVLLALLVGLAPSLAGAQPVVPDGSTATTVGMNAGKTTVHIAPVTSSGLSHNRYARFDVPAAGVDLDNRAAGAQTIINEVTGNQRSLLAGPLTVLGARAQVLIANPNGIKVDGGSFHNTGGLALTTGSVGFADRQVTPFLTQRNALVTTADGAIEIGPGGLSGLFTHLVLAARQLTVNGPVTNANADRDATLQLIAGGSELEFDSSVLPGSLSKPWLQAAPRDAGATTALLVDITRPASLSASNIQIAVTARGAGVRLASAALATAGDFYLASNGEVRLTGGHIDAAGNIRVEKQSAAEPAPTVIAADDGERGFALTAGGQLEILADHINLTRGRLATDAGDIVLGCKDGNATGDFRFVGVDAEDGITAGGGIGLYAQGQDMYLAALTVTAASAVEIMANKFSLNRSADGESALGGSGIYIAADGDVLLTGEIATLEDNFHLQTNGRVELDEVSISAADSARIERLDAEADVPTVTADDFTVSAENHVEIFAGAVDLTHGAIATVSGHITLGNRDEAATGNFHFVGTAPGDGLRAGGGLGLYAQGQDVCLAQLDLRAADGVEIVAKEFTLARGADAESSLSADVFYLQATGDVRLTGDLTTATGDVLVVANQAVLLDGARIQAGHHLRIEQLDANLPAPTVTGRAGGGRGFLLGADGEVAILSGAVDLRHGQIITQNGAVILGRQDEDAAGDFRFAGADADDGIYSAAGLGIYARGKDVVLEKLHLEAAGLAEMVADNFTVADRDSSVSVGGFDLAATGAVGLTGDLRAADGDWRMATNGAARLADVRLVTVGNILLEKLDPAGAVPTLTLGDFELLAAGNIELLSGANELRRGTLTTQAGSVVIGSADATGDFRFVGEDAGDGIYAAGGVGLYAPGRSMQLENLQIQAAGMAEVLSNDFTLGNSTVSAGGFALAAAGKARLTNDELTATKGDWRMAANDEVRADGVRLTAAGGILLEKLNSAGAAPVLTLSDFALSAAGNIELLSGANELRHGTLRTRAGSVLIGSADATGDFRFIGVDADDGIYSANGIGLYAPGQNVILEKLQIIAAGHTAAASQDFTSRDTTVSVGSFDLAASGDIWLNRELTTTAGDWRMAANGEVHLDGARLSAAGSILLEKLNAAGAAPLLTLTDFTLSAVGNIELQSGANELRHGTLTTRAGSVVIGSADATGDFRFIGLGADDGIYAGHSVGLYAPGQSMWLEKIQITANSAAELTAGTLTVTGRLEDGVWLPSSIQADRQHILVSGQVTISAAALLAQQDFILDSGALRVAAVHDGQAWQAANISAHEGELLVSARAGDVVNEGSRLQGRRVTLRADGDVYNHTLDENTPGIIFASGADDGDLTINSGGDVTNLTGRLIGNGAVSISAAGKVYHGTAHTDEPGSGEKIYYTRKSGWFFWRQKTSGWYLKLSDLTVSGQLAYILAGKGLAIAADELENDGAEIIANGGDLRIDVSRLVNRAIASGEANFERRAYYLWRRDRGASTMQVHGGHISAAGALTVNAAESVTDRGGQMLAMSDLTISAPRINARAIELFSYYQRQDGMREIWLGEHVRLRSSQSGAEFISWGGAVNLFSPEPAHIYGGGVQAAGAVNAPGGLDLTVPEVEREPYGFLHFMF